MRPRDEADVRRATGRRPGRGRRLENRFSRARFRVGALAVVGLWLAVGASATQAEVRIVAPANDAIKTKAKVRVVLAVSGARSLRVSLDNSDITRRLARHGRLREAVLRGRLVEPGAHWLVVRWRAEGGGAERRIERRFLVARRFRSLAGKLFPRRSVHSASGVLRLRLAVRRGVGLMRARVNGRRVRVPHIGRLWPTTTLTLGARHGLRFGRNRVSVLAHDFRKARYDRESWTVVMRRSRPLAAGIAKHRAKAGGRAVRLDGRGARPTRAGRRLRWSWRIVRKPRGSRVRLVGRHRPRPRLRPDVPGRYRLAVAVSEHSGKRRGARAAQTGPETVHPVTVVADANTLPLGASLDIDLGGQNPPRDGSIVVDEAVAAGLPDSDCWNGLPPTTGARRCVYPLRFPSAYPYLLVVDAQTLAPKAPIKQLPPSDDGLRDAISPWAGQNVIAILVNGGTRRYVQDDPPKLAELQKPSAYIFSPTAASDRGIRSGWYSEASTGDDVAEAEIGGFFQKSWPVGHTEASGQYQFVPGNYVQFDTSKANAPAGRNTMVVAGKEYTSQLSGDGFQVLVLNKALEPILGTPSVFAGDPAGMSGLANLLGQARSSVGRTVLVQSIGRPVPTEGRGGPDGAVEWNDAAAQIEALGGNRDVFLSLGERREPIPAGTTGWYSLVAAPQIGRSGLLPWPIPRPIFQPPVRDPVPAVEASAPLTGESGDLSGVLRRNQSWQYEPMLDEVGAESVGELLTLAYRPPGKWPFSGDPEARRVLDWLTQYNRGGTDLSPLGNGDCYDPGKLRDVRSSYCSMELDWSTYHTGLGDSGTGFGVCAQYDKVKGEAELAGVTEEKYKAVCDQVSREIGQLADVKGDMGRLRALIADGAGSALTAYLAVLDMTDKVKAAVEANNKPKRNVTAEAFEIAGTSLELVSLFIPETEAFAGVLEAAEFLAPTLSLTGEITSLVEGDGQGEAAVHAPTTLDAGELATEMDNRLKAAGAAFDHAWDMLISDPEKLNTAHENFTLDPTNPNNDPECKQPGKTCGIWRGMARKLSGQAAQAAMQNGVRHWAAGKFMAATYDVWLVPSGYIFQDGKWWDVDVQSFHDVTPSDLPTIGCYVSQRQNDFHPFSSPSPPPDAAYYFRDKWGLTRPRDGTFANIRGNNLLLLAQSSDVWDRDAAKNYPPQSLLSQLYSPPNLSSVGGGYGWKRPWLYTKGQPFVTHQTTKEFRSGYLGCGWFHS